MTEFRPPVLKDIEAASRYSWNMNGLRENPTIQNNRYFIHVDRVRQWFNQMRPNKPYELFSGYGDTCIDSSFLDIANDSNLISWHSSNLVFNHPKIHPIPISVIGGQPQDTEHELMSVARQVFQKKNMFNANYELWTNRTEREKCLRCTGIPLAGRKTRPEFFKDVAESFFCISPNGNGIDCHRTWEALSLCTIPIVTRNPMVELGLYDGLPVIILDKWEDFDKSQFTEDRYNRMIKGFDRSKLNIWNWTGRSKEKLKMKKAINIEGWISETELDFLRDNAKGKSRLLEIGSWLGRSSQGIVEGMDDGAVLTCLDTWRGSDNEPLHNIAKAIEDPIYKSFCNNHQENITSGKVRVLRMDSCEGLRHLFNTGEKFDFIFIDGNHAYEFFYKDLLLSMDVLVPGGLLCGHDLGWGPKGIDKALDEVIPNQYFKANGSIWVMKK
jgi:predicted O-methyltransferase YrrM